MLKARILRAGQRYVKTLCLRRQAALAGAALVLAGAPLMAADIEATLYPGQTTNSSASVTLPTLPPSADVLFSFDVTSSMGGVIDTAKKNAISLMTALEATGVSFHFGVTSFGDYPATYDSCGYSNTYGASLPGLAKDYPYALNQALTTNLPAVSTAISSLQLTPGMDFPEAYSRALYESYADPNVLWRSGAKKVVVNFGDSIPHDCNINDGIAGATGVESWGGDPGRDQIIGTADDLVLKTVLEGMASNHVVLLAARVSTDSFDDYYFDYWTNWTGRTGGKAFASTGSTLINDLMHEITNSLVVSCVNRLLVAVDPPMFSSWLTSTPASYGVTCSGDIRNFGLAVNPPAGTPTGDYSFTVNFVDDKAVVYLSRTVLVHVPIPLPQALNNSNLVWTTDSTVPWFGQASVSHDGVASGRSYFMGDNQQSTLTTIANGPGTLSFWWKVSSQTNADWLGFVSYGGGTTNLTAQISGETGWTQVSTLLPGGAQTLVWSYAKDASQSAGLDAGFVDQVSYVFGPTLPFIITQPVSQLTMAASSVSFSVVAGGTPALSYQWRRNGSDLPGATAPVLTIPSAGNLDAGLYSVRVYDPYGGTNSANAALTVIPLILRGDNSLGQAPTSLLISNPVAIGAGSYHTLAQLADGTVVGWGENYDAQCNPPQGLSNVVQVAGGGYHSLALRADGTVVAWGANEYHQCDAPTGLSNVIAVAAGRWHSLVLRADGSLVAWGDNAYGQTALPPGLNQAVAVAAGGNHSLALRPDGTVVAWGDNFDADGHFAGQSLVPAGLNGVQAIGAGDYHSLGVRSNGTVVAWGDDSQGQCDVPTNLNAVTVVGGGTHTIAIKADSTAVAWGNNWNGQCNYPTNLLNIAAVAAGATHSVFLVGLAQPKIFRAAHTSNQFSLCVPSYPGKNYALEYKTSLNTPAWTPTPPIRGNGGLLTLTDPAATNAPRFYRVEVW